MYCLRCKSPHHKYYTLYFVQVDLMMSDKHPVDAMCYICKLGLFYVVFAFPEKLDPPVLDKHDRYVFVLIFKYVSIACKYPTICHTVTTHQISGIVDFYESVCTSLFISISVYTSAQFQLIFH